MKKRKLSFYIILLITIVFSIIWFVPFEYSLNDKKGYDYCKYRFAVYRCTIIESEGEGYGTSDTYIGSVILEEKVGGILEYFGLKPIQN